MKSPDEVPDMGEVKEMVESFGVTEAQVVEALSQWPWECHICHQPVTLWNGWDFKEKRAVHLACLMGGEHGD